MSSQETSLTTSSMSVDDGLTPSSSSSSSSSSLTISSQLNVCEMRLLSFIILEMSQNDHLGLNEFLYEFHDKIGIFMQTPELEKVYISEKEELGLSRHLVKRLDEAADEIDNKQWIYEDMSVLHKRKIQKFIVYAQAGLNKLHKYTVEFNQKMKKFKDEHADDDVGINKIEFDNELFYNRNVENCHNVMIIKYLQFRSLITIKLHESGGFYIMTSPKFLRITEQGKVVRNIGISDTIVDEIEIDDFAPEMIVKFFNQNPTFKSHMLSMFVRK